MSSIKVSVLEDVLFELACRYVECMREVSTDELCGLYIHYKGKLDTILELCMLLDLDELLFKIEELGKE